MNQSPGLGYVANLGQWRFRIRGGVASACLCGLDRKSTRLNSSHLVISYAVFCLKKKNNTSAPVSPARPQLHPLFDRAICFSPPASAGTPPPACRVSHGEPLQLGGISSVSAHPVI